MNPQPRVRHRRRSGYAFRKTAGGGRLYCFKRTRTHVLILEHGQLRQRTFTPEWRFSGPRQCVDLGAYFEWAALVDQAERGERAIYVISDDTLAMREFVRLLPTEV